MATTVPTSSGGAAPTGATRAVVSSFVGTAIEWYDFFIYGTAAALVLGSQFFPGHSGVASTMAAFATFAIGFVARPIGGAVMGHYGDKIGRKSMLVVSMFLMGGATVAIGLLPTYAAIGAWAPALLVAFRFVQGLGVGGEWGGAVLMATEHAPKGRVGLYGAAPQLGVPAGVVLANGVFLACTQLTTEEQFLSWGWRVPFLLSFVLVGVALWIRLGVMESPAFREIEAKHEVARVPLLEVLTKSWKTVLLAGGTFVATHGIANIFMVFALSYGTTALGVDRSTMLTLLIVSCPVWMLGMALSAYWSDIYGRRRVYRVAAVALVVVSTFFFTLFDTASVPMMQLAMVLLAFVMGATVGPQSALFAELFPVHLRYSGASLAYQIGAILGGGIAPFIATWLFSEYGSTGAVTGYFLVVGALSLVCTVVLLRHTTLEDLGVDPALGSPAPAGGSLAEKAEQ